MSPPAPTVEATEVESLAEDIAEKEKTQTGLKIEKLTIEPATTTTTTAAPTTTVASTTTIKTTTTTVVSKLDGAVEATEEPAPDKAEMPMITKMALVELAVDKLKEMEAEERMREDGLVVLQPILTVHCSTVNPWKL